MPIYAQLLLRGERVFFFLLPAVLIVFASKTVVYRQYSTAIVSPPPAVLGGPSHGSTSPSTRVGLLTRVVFSHTKSASAKGPRASPTALIYTAGPSGAGTSLPAAITQSFGPAVVIMISAWAKERDVQTGKAGPWSSFVVFKEFPMCRPA